MAGLWGENDEDEDDDDEQAGVEEEDEEEQQQQLPNGDGDEDGDDDGDGEDEDDLLDMEGDDDTPRGQALALLMRFCPHDSSMLYPQEDKRNKCLQYACKLCRYSEVAINTSLVYRNEKKKEVKNILHTVPSSIADDPTLARSSKANCLNCGHNVAVFFQSSIAQSDSLALIFVCCNCGHKWVN